MVTGNTSRLHSEVGWPLGTRLGEVAGKAERWGTRTQQLLWNVRAWLEVLAY